MKIKEKLKRILSGTITAAMALSFVPAIPASPYPHQRNEGALNRSNKFVINRNRLFLVLFTLLIFILADCNFINQCS